MNPCIRASLLLATILISNSHAQQFEITVRAGSFDRTNVPVRVEIDKKRVGRNQLRSVSLLDAVGKSIAAQWTGPSLFASEQVAGEIHFVLSSLKAGESLVLKATLTAEQPRESGGFAWRDTPGLNTVLRWNDRPVIRYHYEALDESTPASRERTYKVFHHVFSPDGKVLTTGGLSDDPDVHSPHHRGIFFGFNRISYGKGQTADTWHCLNGVFQSQDAFVVQEAGPVLGRHRLSIGWHGMDKQTFADEQRELTVYNVPGGQLIEFASTIKSRVGPLNLDGDPQHAGLHFRAHNEVFAKTSNQTIYVRPDGAGQPGETRNWDPATRTGPVNLPWNCMSFVLGTRRFSVAYLDHPNNPKEARQSEREYGRFGTYFKTTVDQGKPMKVRYRFWLQDGLMQPEQVEPLSRNFVDPVEVQIR